MYAVALSVCLTIFIIRIVKELAQSKAYVSTSAPRVFRHTKPVAYDRQVIPVV